MAKKKCQFGARKQKRSKTWVAHQAALREAEAEAAAALDRNLSGVDAADVSGRGVSGLSINHNVENGVSTDPEIVPLLPVSRSDDGWRVHRAVLARDERIKQEVFRRSGCHCSH